MTKIEKINEERELLNYEYYHLYNLARHFPVAKHLEARSTLISDTKNQEEYGIITISGGIKRTWRFPSLERCQREAEIRPGSIIVRGRDFSSKRNWTEKAPDERKSTKSYLAVIDESGNIEAPETDVEVDNTTAQLISNELAKLGFIKGSGCRPPARILCDLAMRYNDIVPEDFAAAVIRHCELPRSESDEIIPSKSPWKSPEDKEAWLDTPAGQAWVKENPTPSIFALPTPDILKHRRDTC